MLGWIALLKEATKLNSNCLLENLINLSSTRLIGGGQRLPSFSLTQPKKEGSGSQSKWPLRSQFRIRGEMKSLLPPPLSGITYGTKLRHKNGAFMWLVIYKAMAVNKWHGKISKEIDKCCPDCGPHSVESVERRFYSCPLAQQGWQYPTNIIWQFFAKRRDLGPQKSFSMMQCLFDQHFARHLKSSVPSSSFLEAAFLGLFGAKGMICF